MKKPIQAGRDSRAHLLGLVCVGILTVAPHDGRAQDREEASALEEVVVTARKREEKLQDVPDSITAIGATEVAERRIDGIDDVNGITPNFHVLQDQDPATNIISVRGIGTSRLLAAAVAFAVDGVILPDSDAFMTDLTDVESIEVLRGPQGGLYGRNAIAGVVNITTKRPTRELEGEVRADMATVIRETCLPGSAVHSAVTGCSAGSRRATMTLTAGSRISTTAVLPTTTAALVSQDAWFSRRPIRCASICAELIWTRKEERLHCRALMCSAPRAARSPNVSRGSSQISMNRDPPSGK